MSKKLNEVNDALRAIAEGNEHSKIGGVISCWTDYLEECRRDMVGMIVPAVRLCNEIVAEPDRAKKDAEGILDNLRKLYDFIGGKEVDPGVKQVDHSGKPNASTQGETMNTDTLKGIIEDAHKLAKVDIAPDLVKPAVETIALRLERLMNPPLTGFAKYLSLPELGIQFRRHKSANMTKLIATWSDDANDHIYEISVQRDGDTPNCGWRALATNDGHNVFQLRAKCRSNCERFALSAMKHYLKRGHRKTYRTIAKAKEEK